MPVLGHAVAGLATTLFAPAIVDVRVRRPQQNALADYWSVALVAVAYLPDIAAHAVHLAGVSSASRLTHSLAFALLTVPIVGWRLSRLWGASVQSAIRIALFTILLHIVLDVLQSTDRAILWLS
jgi:hypothetical protein